jgi:hypothetical protein
VTEIAMKGASLFFVLLVGAAQDAAPGAAKESFESAPILEIQKFLQNKRNKVQY